MKKTNSIIIATIIATFVISMFAFQPNTTEASNNVSPSATPSPRTKRPKPVQSPRPIISGTRNKTKQKPSFRPNPAGDGTTEQFRTKQPRKRNAGKRVHKP